MLTVETVFIFTVMLGPVVKEHPAFNSFDARSSWGQSALDLATPEIKEALKDAYQRQGKL